MRQQGSYAATKLEKTSLSGQVTMFALSSLGDSLLSAHNQVVSMRSWETPVPIPNTMVKP